MVQAEVGADTLLDMGNLADERGDHDGALTSFKEALQLEREIGNESMQAACLNSIGSVYSEKGQYEDALAYLQGLPASAFDVVISDITDPSGEGSASHHLYSDDYVRLVLAVARFLPG